MVTIVWTPAAGEGARAWPPVWLVREVLPGPVAARVLRVVDGDTILVRARVWVGQEIEIRVRIAGIDAPELRSACAAERRLARQSRAFLVARIGTRPVRLLAVQYGKYAGRVLARVAAADGTDLGQALLEAGLARPYGGGRRGKWCP